MATPQNQQNTGDTSKTQQVAYQRKLRKPLHEEPDRSEPGILSRISTALSSMSGASTIGKTPDRARSRLEDLKLHIRHWWPDRVIEECLQLCRELEQAEKLMRSLKEEYLTISDEKSVLESRLACQDVDVRKAQESAFELMASSVPKATDDEVVRSKLKGVRARWKMFAKEWAAADIQDGEGTTALFKKLMAPDEKQSYDGLWHKQNRGKAAAVLLNAELARFIGDEIILQPFTAAVDYGTKQHDNLKPCVAIMEALDMVYHLSWKKNQAAAHLWRSQTVDLIEMPEREGPPSTLPKMREAPQRRENYYRKLVTDFESSNARVLYRDCEEQESAKRQAQLLELFRSIGELTSKLWSQKVVISVVGSKDLLKTPFENGNKVLDAHAIHRLEEGDKRMDGMPIQVVVEPAILAFGNERGESYEEYKVWGKAVVWMSSGAAKVTQ